MERQRRPLNAVEERYLRLAIASVDTERRRAIVRSLVSGMGLAGLIGAAAYWAAKDVSLASIATFVLGLAAVLAAMGVFSAIRSHRAHRRTLVSATKSRTAAVMDIRASAVVEVEEVEDEGACFIFQIAPDEMVILEGQDFYESPRFPNDDFSLVELLDEEGAVAAALRRCRGRKLVSQRRISAEAGKDLKWKAERVRFLPGKVEELFR
jgi:hypothetical protein